MAKLKITCPACGTTLTVDEVHLGKTGLCKQCGAKFPIKPPEAPSVDVTQPAGPRPTAQAKAKTADTTQPAKTGRTPVVMPASEATQPAESAPPARHRQTAVTQPAGVAPGSGQRPAEVTIPQDKPKKVEDVKLAEDAVPAEWNIGDLILDTYEVKQVHTGGGMGLVYRVHHRNWNMDLAVKSPRTEYFATEEQKADFIRECETWINLGLHPNIVSCYYVRTLGAIPRVFAEYVEGGSLKDWIDSRKLYEGGPDEALKRILDIAIQMAWGLHYAHEHEDENKQKQSLIHQDFKPANVMMTPDGEAKVTDFGLARARGGEGKGLPVAPGHGQQSILVSSGGMTPAYCSPEQANGEKLTRATDIWSWGLSVLEMFTGGITWMAGQVAAEALGTYLEGGAEDKSIPKMPEDLAGIIRQCFQWNPDDRSKNMAQIVGRLKDIYQGITSEEYASKEPKAADLLADGLNNRGVSTLDLGRKEEAEKLFEQALKADPHHPEAIYNRGLLFWRGGQITDDGLVRQIEEALASRARTWRAQYVLGLVHRERGDSASAIPLLEEAARDATDNITIQNALAASRKALSDTQVRERTFQHRSGVATLAVSNDGKYLLSGCTGARYSDMDDDGDPSIWMWNIATGECERRFPGHDSTAAALAFSRDGRFVISAYLGGVCFWDRDTGARVRQLDFFKQPPKVVSREWAVCASKGLALQNMLGKIHRWNLATGTYAGVFDGVANATWVGISPDGSLALSGNGAFSVSTGQQDVLQLREVKTGRELVHFSPLRTGVRCAIFVMGGRYVLGGCNDGRLRLWDVTDGSLVREFIGHQGRVTGLTTVPNSRVAISCGVDVVAGTKQFTVRAWDIAHAKCLRTFSGHTAEVSCVATSQDGRLIFSSSADRTVRLWAFRPGTRQSAALCKPRGFEDTWRVSRQRTKMQEDARRLIGAGDFARAYSVIKQAMMLPECDRHKDLLEARALIGSHGQRSGLAACWLERKLEGDTSRLWKVAFSCDGKRVRSCTSDGAMRIWERRSGTCVRSTSLKSKDTSLLALSPDLRVAVMSRTVWKKVPPGDGAVLANLAPGSIRQEMASQRELWITDVDTGECLNRFDTGGELDYPIVLSSDGKWILLSRPVVNHAYTAEVWRVHEGRRVAMLPLSGHASCAAFSLDGRLAIIGSSTGSLHVRGDNAVSIFEVATGRRVQSLSGHSGNIQCVESSPDGGLTLSGSWDRTVKVWENATGRCMHTLTGHSAIPVSVAISPDMTCAMSASQDSTARLWDLERGECLRTLEHGEEVTALAFSKDCRYLLSAEGRMDISSRNVAPDTGIRIWECLWNYQFPSIVSWDEGAKPYLDTFLIRHCRYVEGGTSRIGKPEWDEEDFEELIKELQYRGYGWLRPEGVRKRLEEMRANWQGPPPLAWEK